MDNGVSNVSLGVRFIDPSVVVILNRFIANERILLFIPKIRLANLFEMHGRNNGTVLYFMMELKINSYQSPVPVRYIRIRNLVSAILTDKTISNIILYIFSHIY